jgi:hypothetical protein
VPPPWRLHVHCGHSILALHSGRPWPCAGPSRRARGRRSRNQVRVCTHGDARGSGQRPCRPRRRTSSSSSGRKRASGHLAAAAYAACGAWEPWRSSEPAKHKRLILGAHEIYSRATSTAVGIILLLVCPPQFETALCSSYIRCHQITHSVTIPGHPTKHEAQNFKITRPPVPSFAPVSNKGPGAYPFGHDPGSSDQTRSPKLQNYETPRALVRTSQQQGAGGVSQVLFVNVGRFIQRNARNGSAQQARLSIYGTRCHTAPHARPRRVEGPYKQRGPRPTPLTGRAVRYLHGTCAY